MSESMAMVLERAARLHGPREAVVDGDVRWTYAELHRRVAGFDASLTTLGLRHGDVVGVLAMNSAAHLVTWLAIPRSGRVLNDLNFRLAPAELQLVLRDSRARALVVDDAFLDAGRALAEACDTVDHLIYAGSGPAPHGTLSFAELCTAPSTAPAPVAPDDVAGIFYTGGTTGRPKGAMLSHRNLLANAKHMLILSGYREDDTYLHAAPMFHLADSTSTFALTWVGGRHVIIPGFDPQLWLRTVEAEWVTHAVLVPTMINMVVNDKAAGAHDLSSLRVVIYGASPMPEALLRRASEAIPCGWGQAYGMTEAAPMVTYLTPEEHRLGLDGDARHAARLRSAGRPIVGVDVEIRRPDDARADIGEVGEICVQGPNVMLGYWRREAETAAALGDDGWYRSGDAGFVDEDGYLYVVDRVKDMIISGGENVYCSEVEQALASHPDVLECAVFGVPDERWGERVHAAIVTRPGTPADEQAIVAHCRERIAGYKLPRSIDFHSDALPKSGAGKILKRTLREPYWAGRDREVS